VTDTSSPYLSVVVTSRNDDHGGNPLARLQAFINCFDAQCRETGLDAEVIVVEWNPPPERPRLASLVRFPEPRACTYRFIEVPPALHRTLAYSDVLPLFQMIAKNVGIRRARGRFILATNIDILFSTELIAFLASGRLEPGVLYRVDRHDVDAAVPIEGPLDEQMAFCAHHQLRLHTRWGSFPVDSDGRVVTADQDIVTSPLIALASGWYQREGAPASGFYRWAQDRADIRLTPAGDPDLAGCRTALEITVEPNPYDPQSWVEIEVTDDQGASLARARIDRRIVLRVALEPTTATRTIALKVVAAPSDARRQLALFERRDAMCYRVRSITWSRYAPDADRLPFVYPTGGWRLISGTDFVDPQPPEGLSVVMDNRRGSYGMDYGPMRAPHSGTYLFSLTCDVVEGKIGLGLLGSDRESWIPSVQTEMLTAGGRVIETSAELKAGDQFTPVIYNNRPDNTGMSRWVVKAFRGSCPIEKAIAARSSLQRRPRASKDPRLIVTGSGPGQETI